MAEHLVYLGLGSNLGERAANLRRGLQLMQAGGLELLAVSDVYETAPWGGVEQPDFYNLVAAGRTELAPLALLRLAKQTEREVGRLPGVRWGARVLDIDILLYDEIIYNNIEDNEIFPETDSGLGKEKNYKELTFCPQGLIIPHKEMYHRAFVLIPLLQIAPDVRLPGRAQSAAGLLAALPESERQGVRRVGALAECDIDNVALKGVGKNGID